MAFRASNQSLQDVLVQIKRTAFAVKRDADALRADSGSQPIPFGRIQDFFRTLQQRRMDMTAKAATPDSIRPNRRKATPCAITAIATPTTAGWSTTKT